MCRLGHFKNPLKNHGAAAEGEANGSWRDSSGTPLHYDDDQGLPPLGCRSDRGGNGAWGKPRWGHSLFALYQSRSPVLGHFSPFSI